MIKCPNCGSTAQVKIDKPVLSQNGRYINTPCECGCGCVFTLEHELSDYDCVYVEHIERKEVK